MLSLVLAGVGAIVAMAMSRSISRPLREVTEAAESLAAGRGVGHVRVKREDEIGRLATSFNIMADEVQRSHQLLEDRVASRTAALEAANRELESFSYSVSHDLRAPLRAVDGFAAILTEDHAAELSDDARRYLSRIRTSAQQMGALIDDLLAFSRLGRQQISQHDVDMDDLARTVVEEACRTEGRDTAEIDIRPLPPARGERSMLKQVFANLVQNALKFTRGRQPARIAIGASVSEGEIVYFVSDDGVGFDMGYADKLFGVFQRLHPAEEFEGTGVGLAVVKRVVERHGGRVWAESSPGEGATFHFTIPPEAPPERVGADAGEEASWK
jgi:light-regulated signal transduction histidine kinase (bacteriophytochrome)